MKSKSALAHKKIFYRSGFQLPGALIILCLLFVNFGCQKTSSISEASTDNSFIDLKEAGTNNFTQVNLVSDVEEYDPVFIDPNLVNAWGVALGPLEDFWVSAAETGVTTIYGADGETVLDPVNIPFDLDPNGGNPTGQIFNSTTKFVIPSTNEVSAFIFVTENGTVEAWASGPTAFIVADRSASEAVYKGITMAKNGSSNYLYATNFKGGTVDVFDESFNYVSSMAFNDPNIPSGFAPFNIKFMNGYLWVTYAKQLLPDKEDDEAGPGNGYVDIYNTDGSFVSRFASQDVLNSPWGMTEVPGQSAVMIANFGDGRINVFKMDGTFMKPLKSGGSPIEIDGLWSLTFPGKGLPPEQRKRLYFTSGPDDEEHGVFGYLTQQ